MTERNKCQYWGENRKEELYLDVGCTLGHSNCSPKCKDYSHIKAQKKQRVLVITTDIIQEAKL